MHALLCFSCNAMEIIKMELAMASSAFAYFDHFYGVGIFNEPVSERYVRLGHTE